MRGYISLNFIWSLLGYLLFVVLFMGCAPKIDRESQTLIGEMERSLKELLDVWYPVALDTVYGGFLSNFSYDWRPEEQQYKMIVTQARHVWTSSVAAVYYNDDKYRRIADHGVRFLKDKMWHQRYGGFYMLRNREGNPEEGFGLAEKSAYGNAFAIYALASYYQMSGDTTALQLAQKTFGWLEEHNYDPKYGGYFDRQLRDGSLPADFRWKDQNSSIHLMEAFTALYTVWPDSLLRQRLLEMLTLIRDRMTTNKGYLVLYFQSDWTPVSFQDSSAIVRAANIQYDHVSFGHDVETGYLMLEAEHVLGLQHDSKTLTVAKKMVDHALANGWDEKNGGFYDAGYYFDNSDSISIINEGKTWWVEAEGLNALLLMAKLFPEEKKYYDAFKKQWEYINNYLVDHEHGGWYREGLDKNPEQLKAPKASIWKINYHNTRALMNCIKLLKSEHELIK